MMFLWQILQMQNMKRVERIRIEMLNRQEYMKDTRVNLNTTSRTTSNTSFNIYIEWHRYNLQLLVWVED